MENNTQTVIQQDTSANPAPLGLLGFALTTILLNIHNAGYFPLDAMILSMGVFYGGLAQVIVGVLEWKKGATFGATAFTSYGFFWIVLVSLILLPKTGIATAASPLAMGWFLTVWGVFSFFMFLCTFRMNRALQVVFGTLVILFALLAASNFTGSHNLHVIAGYEGIFCGASAFYAAMAQIINEVYGREILPMGAVK